MEDDIGNLSEELDELKIQNIPKNENNSCFLDTLLMALFYKKNIFIDYCFLHSLLKMEDKKSKWIYGTDTKMDFRKRTEIRKSLVDFIKSIRHNNEPPSVFVNQLRQLLAETNFKSFKDVNVQQDSMECLYALVEILQLDIDFNSIKLQVFGTNDLLHNPPTELQETTNRIDKTSCIHRVLPCEVVQLNTRIDSGILKDGFTSVDGQVFQRQITVATYIPSNQFFILHIDRTIKNAPLIDNTSIFLQDFMFDEFELCSIGIHNGQTIHSGHYTCLIKKSNWILYDDVKPLEMLGSLTDAITKTNANKKCVFLLFKK